MKKLIYCILLLIVFSLMISGTILACYSISKQRWVEGYWDYSETDSIHVTLIYQINDGEITINKTTFTVPKSKISGWCNPYELTSNLSEWLYQNREKNPSILVYIESWDTLYFELYTRYTYQKFGYDETLGQYEQIDNLYWNGKGNYWIDGHWEHSYYYQPYCIEGSLSIGIGVIILFIVIPMIYYSSLPKKEPKAEKEEERSLTIMDMIYYSFSKAIEFDKKKNWTCEYCNLVNDWKDKTCYKCGSPRRENKERMVK